MDGKTHRIERLMTCHECGKEYWAQRITSKYCGDVCRKKKTNRVSYQNRKARAEQAKNG